MFQFTLESFIWPGGIVSIIKYLPDNFDILLPSTTTIKKHYDYIFLVFKFGLDLWSNFFYCFNWLPPLLIQPMGVDVMFWLVCKDENENIGDLKLLLKF